MTPSRPSTRPPPPGGVYQRLAEFVAFLRYRGLPIGLGAEVDLARAAGLVPGLDREDFRQACRTILAKSPEELERLDRAFELFWALGAQRPGIPSPGQSIAATRSGAPKTRSHPPGASPESERETPAETTTFGVYSATAPAPGHLLTPLSERDRHALHRGARQFRRFAATLPGRRLVRTRRGSVDFPETLRQSVRRGGEWVELSRHQPQDRRAELVILWDVSGSMREHDARCFALVYALQRVSRSARVFAFSTSIQEITDEVRRHGYERATAWVAARIDPAEGGTRIGPCLRQFSEQHGSIVRDRSTVVVVSDGWDLADSDVVAGEIRRIRRRAHRIVWISPYASRPGFEARTAGLVAALPYTDALLGPEDFTSPFPLRPRSWKPERPRRTVVSALASV